MGITELQISAEETHAKKIADHLAEWEQAGPPATSVFEDNENESNSDWRVTAYFEQAPDIATITAYLGELLNETAKQSLSLKALEDQDWVAQSQSGLIPVHAGRFIVHGNHDRQNFKAHRYAIEIDAGQAFGTAHHGTTRGCLLALDWLLTRQNFHNILDVGTGSGILSIACAKKTSRAAILATDLDDIATKVAEENFHKNAVPHQVKALTANGLAHPIVRQRTPFDLIIANILAAPLIGLTPSIDRASTFGTYIILSGLLNEQAPKILARYRSFGFVVKKRLSLEGWSTLILQKRH